MKAKVMLSLAASSRINDYDVMQEEQMSRMSL